MKTLKSYLKACIILFIIAFNCGSAFSQNAQLVSDNSFTESQVLYQKNIPPTFPGGYEALWSYFQDELQAGKVAGKYFVNGQVVVNFNIELDGSITNVKVLQGINEELDSEALRVAESMPNWNPAKMNGKVVGANYSLPIVFSWEQIAEYEDYGDAYRR